MVVNLIGTCTKRKSVAPPAQLHLRTLNGLSVEAAAEEWIRRVSTAPEQRVALDLYQGDHWSVFAGIPAWKPEWKFRQWVLSAGYGLIEANARIGAYSATLSSGHPDDVGAIGQGGRRNAIVGWWRALSLWSGPSDAPRSIAAVAEAYPDDAIVIAGSAAYLASMAEDIHRAVDILGTDRVALFSAGSKLDENHIVFDARLSSLLGGALMSLNVRALRAAIKNAESPSRVVMQREVDRLSAGLAAHTSPKRRRLSDAEVVSFVAEYSHNGAISCSALLRQLRMDHGQACEQKRFKSLYSSVLNGSLA